MQYIPLNAVPSQTVAVSLNNQSCQINVYQKVTGLYLDLYVNNVLIIGGVICENLNRIVRSIYLGFSGDLCFIDNAGTDDPDYTGLGPTNSFVGADGARYNLLYLTPADLTQANLFYGD